MFHYLHAFRFQMLIINTIVNGICILSSNIAVSLDVRNKTHELMFKNYKLSYVDFYWENLFACIIQTSKRLNHIICETSHDPRKVYGCSELQKVVSGYFCKTTKKLKIRKHFIFSFMREKMPKGLTT